MFGGKKAPKLHHDCEARWRVEPRGGPGHLTLSERSMIIKLYKDVFKGTSKQEFMSKSF